MTLNAVQEFFAGDLCDDSGASNAPHGEPSAQPIRAVAIAGDGIGPEITAAVKRVLAAAGAPLIWTDCQAGAEVAARGEPSGLPRETVGAIEENGFVLKGPLATGIGTGGKSANVTLRKHFELYANVRPARMLPGVVTPFAGRDIDLVVVRENVEDLYAGIEHMQTPDVAQCLKLITRQGSHKIAEAAFAVARAEGRRHVTCASKANIMKLTEGLFKGTLEEVAARHPDIAASHMLIDNLAHRLVVAPEDFDVIVTTNMNGDIISDLTAGLVGGLGLAPSANLGLRAAMFEAVHGSAPDIAGKGMANPTALLLAAIMMLRHAGALRCAAAIEHALFVTLEAGEELTPDLARPRALQAGSTAAFTDRIVSNLGRRSPSCPSVSRAPLALRATAPSPRRPAHREEAGLDVFIEWTGRPEALAAQLQTACAGLPFELQMISNRGLKMFPGPVPQADVVDHWRCRFSHGGGALTASMTGRLLAAIEGFARWCHVERLPVFDENPGYTVAQGQ